MQVHRVIVDFGFAAEIALYVCFNFFLFYGLTITKYRERSTLDMMEMVFLIFGTTASF